MKCCKATYVHQNWRTLNRIRLRTLRTSPTTRTCTMPALGATRGLWRRMVQRTGAGSRCRDILSLHPGVLVTLTGRSVCQVRFALLTTISLLVSLGFLLLNMHEKSYPIVFEVISLRGPFFSCSPWKYATIYCFF